MPAVIFCFSTPQAGNLQTYLRNNLIIKGVSIDKTYVNYPTSSDKRAVQCKSTRQALIMASCRLKKHDDSTVLVGLFYKDTNELISDLSTFSSSVTKQVILYSDFMTIGLNRLRNVLKYHVYLEKGIMAIAPIEHSKSITEASVACVCHNIKTSIFWICTGCGSVYCRLVPSCGKCRTRFIFSKNTPGFL